MIKAEVIEHTRTNFGAEAVTMMVVLPRICLSEFNTHRKFSRNTSSSRAIPILKMIKHVYNNMFIPVYWGKNQAGMQAAEELTGTRLKLAKLAWKTSGKIACGLAWTLNKIGVHKQITNRLIENFSYVTVVFTTTDLLNFISLRAHADAQPEIKAVAEAILLAYDASTPRLLNDGEWHLPFITEFERSHHDIEQLKQISAARCASTSYVTVDGKAITPSRALEICTKLSNADPIHASPFEHQLTPDVTVDIEYRVAKSKKKLQVATVWKNPHLHGNTVGYIQARKLMNSESKTTDLPYQLILS